MRKVCPNVLQIAGQLLLYVATSVLTSLPLFLQLKLALDPLCLLNADKVIRISKPKPGEIAEW